MSLHRSLVAKTALKRHRNVLTRAERVRRLEDEGKWQRGQSVFALSKVRVRKVKAGGKHHGKPKKAKEEAAEAPQAAEAPTT